jgi:hypothetical protein
MSQDRITEKNKTDGGQQCTEDKRQKARKRMHGQFSRNLEENLSIMKVIFIAKI